MNETDERTCHTRGADYYIGGSGKHGHVRRRLPIPERLRDREDLVEDCREVSGSGAAIDPTGSGQAVDFLTVTVRPVDTGNHAAVNAAIGDIKTRCNRIIGFFDSLGNGDGGG